MRSISNRTLRHGAASLLAGTAAVTSLLAATLPAAEPAAAEPAGTPPATDIVAVGSDTIQGLYDQYQVHYPGLSSWDATGASPITPKDGCAPITRPAGSGAGIVALGANATTADGAHYCIDIARSSRIPAAGDPTGLSWKALATDAVSWAAVEGGNAPTTLTAAQLYHIFRCDDGWTHWNDPAIGGTSTDAVVPVLPPASSGTRSFFLSALNAAQGLPGALTPGPCVDPATPEENEGTDPLFSPANAAAADVVFPYSAAVYAAQAFNGRGTGNQGALTARQIDGTDPVASDGTYHGANPAFPASFQRTVFNVVRTTSDGAVDALVRWECTDPTAADDLRSFGFGRLAGSDCGATRFTT